MTPASSSRPPTPTTSITDACVTLLTGLRLAKRRLLVPATVVAEAGYMIRKHSPRSEVEFIRSLSNGDFEPVEITVADYARMTSWLRPTSRALDAATSTDPRVRGVGRRALVEQLKSFRVHARHRGTIDDMATTPHRGKASLSGRVGRLVRAHRAELLAVLAKHGVTNAQIFGSAARGDEHEGSDLDLLVDLAPGTDLFDLVHIKAELEEVLGAPVDLIPRDGLKERVRVAAEKDLVPL